MSDNNKTLLIATILVCVTAFAATVFVGMGIKNIGDERLRIFLITIPSVGLFWTLSRYLPFVTILHTPPADNEDVDNAEDIRRQKATRKVLLWCTLGIVGSVLFGALTVELSQILEFLKKLG